MNSITYYEEIGIISKERYQLLKQELLTKNENARLEKYSLRKLQFIGNTGQEAMPGYFLCMRNQDESQIYLEKKYMQGGIYYKKSLVLTKEECTRILKGDLEWMKEHKEKILAEFYLQIVLNHLSPGYLTQYERERVYSQKSECVTFSKSIKRAVGTMNSLLEEPQMYISCLDSEKIQAAYRKEAKLPDVICNMLQIQEGVSEEYAFA